MLRPIAKIALCLLGGGLLAQTIRAQDVPLIATPKDAPAVGGFYIGLEAGISLSGHLDVSHIVLNHPTRCDPFLYTPGAAPTDGECAAGQISIIEGIFVPGAGFAGSAALGYALDSGLRLEAEYLHRRQGSDDRRIPLGSDSGDVP